MRKAAGLILASGVLLAGVGHWLWPEPAAPAPATRSSAAPGPAHNTAAVSDLRLRLRADGALQAQTAGLRIARVLADGSTEAWHATDSRRLANGDLELQLPLGAAGEHWRVVAPGDDWQLYAARVAADTAQTWLIEPVTVAGVELIDADRLPADARVEWRSDTAVGDPLWPDSSQGFDPALRQALRGAPQPTSQLARLWPLPADRPLRARLWIGPVLADSVTLRPVAGQWTKLRFNENAIAEALSRNTRLQLELVSRDDGAPLSGLDVAYVSPEARVQARSDMAGQLHFDSVDLGAPLQFELSVDADDPLAQQLPAWQTLELDPAALEVVGERQRKARIELAAMHWLPVYAEADSSELPPPYPVLLLQAENGGEWQDAPAEFVAVDGGWRLGSTAAGRYRLRLALAPWLWQDSPTLELGAQGWNPASVRLQPPTLAYCRLQLLDAGVPQVGRALWLRGPLRALPPLRMTTDAAGQLRLPAALDAAAWVGDGQREIVIDLRGSKVEADLAAPDRHQDADG